MWPHDSRVIISIPIILLPVWPHTHESGPNGLDRMQRYDMAFSCDTYCGPCGHIQYAHVNINIHCGSCGHLRVSLNYPYLMWPMWPHSHKNEPNGLDHMSCLNAMVWYIATTHNAAHVVIKESALFLYTHCSLCGHHIFMWMCIPVVAMQESLAALYTRCGPCGHRRCSCEYQLLPYPMWPPESLIKLSIPTVDCVTTLQREWTTWVVRMWWYNMVSNRHTYTGPCGHTGVFLYTQFSPCGHRIFMLIS